MKTISTGEVYEVATSNNSSLGICLIVAARRDGTCLGLFFDPRKKEQILSCKGAKARFRALFGDLNLQQNQWKKIGCVEDLEPYLDKNTFRFRRNNLFGQCFIDTYDGDLNFVSEESVDPLSVRHLAEGGVLGAGLIEARLRQGL